MCPQLEPEVKWPNDILIGGRKACGILVEVARGETEREQFAVAGIGVNVNWDTASIPEIAGHVHQPEQGDGRRSFAP